MTVAELIEKLGELPQTAVVVVAEAWGMEGALTEATEVTASRGEVRPDGVVRDYGAGVSQGADIVTIS